MRVRWLPRVKCMVCSARFPRGIIESVCPECGWRAPPIQTLLIGPAMSSAFLLWILMDYIGGDGSFAGIPSPYLLVLFGAISAFGWANYLVVKKRRKALGYDG